MELELTTNMFTFFLNRYKICLSIIISINLTNLGLASSCDDINNQKLDTQPKIGLALGGGGTRGAAHIGVIKELEKNNIKISYISGTSIGAIIGGLYAAGMPIDEIEAIIINKSLLHAYFTTPIPVKLIGTPVALLFRLFGYHPYEGVYTGKRFAQFLNSKIPSCNKNIETFPIKFCAIALNLTDGKTYPIDHGNLGLAIEASSAIPVLRKPVYIEEKLFVDGGVVENLPVDRVRDMGADFVIASDVDEYTIKFHPDRFRHLGSVSERLVNLQLARVDERPLRSADFVIHPYLNGIKLVSTKMSDVNSAIEKGTLSTKLAIPELKRKINTSIKLVDKNNDNLNQYQ